eukprot:1237824-Pyramimonas_sp.AAC.1
MTWYESGAARVSGGPAVGGRSPPLPARPGGGVGGIGGAGLVRRSMPAMPAGTGREESPPPPPPGSRGWASLGGAADEVGVSSSSGLAG